MLKRYTFMLFFLLFFACKPQIEKSILPDYTMVNDICQLIDIDSIKNSIEWLQNMGSRFALKENRKEIATKIKAKFIQYGYTDVVLDSFIMEATFKGKLYITWQYNVIATLRGYKYADIISVLGAHYDNYSSNSDVFSNAPGANDNASGMSAMFEVARVFKQKNITPNQTIHFVAFAAEELGLCGSKDYVLKATNKNMKINMMLNNDMIANWSDKSRDLTVNICNYPNSKDILTQAIDATKRFTTLKSNNNTYATSSDSYPFYLKNYKSLFFMSDAEDTNYHTREDTYKNCNFILCREITKISCALLILNNR